MRFGLTCLCIVVPLLSEICADIQRLAVFIGNNEGLSDERPLKYADMDAQNMSDVFQQYGSFSSDRIYLLKNESIKKIKHTVIEASGRVKEMKRKGGKVLLMFYYSGHGSSEALHIKGKKYPLDQLRDEFAEIDADLKIMIMDACESGSIIRSKGGHLIEDYDDISVEELKNKGTVIISSSSRGELAQESENYHGAVFTHHLVNGLKGVADYSDNREISLWEAFQYASASTRSENVMGRMVQQNPNFDYDLVGRSEIVLTTLHSRNSRLIFENLPSTVLNVYNSRDMNLEARLVLSGRDQVLLNLPSQEYLITYDEGEKVQVAKADLSWNQVRTIRPVDFQTFSRAEVHSKGGRIIRLRPNAVQTDFFVMELDGAQSLPMSVLQFQKLGSLFRSRFGLGFGGSTRDYDMMSIQNRYVRISYSLQTALFRYRFGQILAGMETAYLRIWQTVEDLRFRESSADFMPEGGTRNQYGSNVYEFSIPAVKEFFLPWYFSLCASMNGGALLYRTGEGLQVEPFIRPAAGLGYRF